jgi:DNA polymerase V
MKVQSLHKTPTLEFYFPDYSTALKLPFFDVGISAGFPSPADDFIELTIEPK